MVRGSKQGQTVKQICSERIANLLWQINKLGQELITPEQG